MRKDILSTWLATALSMTAVLAQPPFLPPPPPFWLPPPAPLKGTPAGTGYGGGNTGSNGTSATPTTPSTSTGGSSGSIAGDGTTSGKICTTPAAMCITALVNGSTTTYELAAQASPVGWMAIGFGQSMGNSPMVIMWANSDGSVTLSQRAAPGDTMPTVVASPPRVATLSQGNTQAQAAQPVFSFTIPSDTSGQTKQSLIWAFGSKNPNSNSPSAPLIQHAIGMSGPIQLDVSTPGSSSSNASGGNSALGGTFNPNEFPPFVHYRNLIIAHAVLLSLAFVLLLPAGALYARYLRHTTVNWFIGHWIVQFLITGPLVLVGFIMAIWAVSYEKAPHFNDLHKAIGLALFLLYILQCSLGAYIHFVKDPNRVRRPPQNYLHAFIGIFIVALSLYQVHRGYSWEWLHLGTPMGNGFNVWWYFWVVLLPIAYVAGLAFLPKQFRNEAAAVSARQGGGGYNMTTTQGGGVMSGPVGVRNQQDFGSLPRNKVTPYRSRDSQ